MLSYEDLGSKLVQQFPELREQFESECDWWRPDTPGPHIVYGDVFVPYLVSLLEAGADTEKTQRAFDWIEQILASDDVRVQEVAVVTVLEHLHGKSHLLKLSEPYAGPLAKQAIQDLDAFWHQEGGRAC